MACAPKQACIQSTTQFKLAGPWVIQVLKKISRGLRLDRWGRMGNSSYIIAMEFRKSHDPQDDQIQFFNLPSNAPQLHTAVEPKIKPSERWQDKIGLLKVKAFRSRRLIFKRSRYIVSMIKKWPYTWIPKLKNRWISRNIIKLSWTPWTTSKNK